MPTQQYYLEIVFSIIITTLEHFDRKQLERIYRVKIKNQNEYIQRVDFTSQPNSFLTRTTWKYCRVIWSYIIYNPKLYGFMNLSILFLSLCHIERKEKTAQKFVRLGFNKKINYIYGSIIHHGRLISSTCTPQTLRFHYHDIQQLDYKQTMDCI